MQFPEVPVDQWFRCFADLVHLEDCFTVGSAIGLVRDQPFVFELSDPQCRHIAKALPYPPEARTWLADYMRQQCTSNVYRQVLRNCEPDPAVVCNMVLVK